MKPKNALLLTIVIALWLALAVTPAPARAGGWAVVTLEDWPEGVRTGEPVTIVFSVRQHGFEPAGGYEPVIRLNRSESGTNFSATAHETDRTGFYTAGLTFPEAGTWNWSISYHGGPEFAQTMPELVVSASSSGVPIAAASPDLIPGLSAGYLIAALGALTLFAGAGFFAVTRSRAAVAAALAGVLVLAAGLLSVPRAQAAQSESSEAGEYSTAETTALYDRGRILFEAKGCIVCHAHAELRVGYTGVTTDIGPDFTYGTKRPIDFLRTWLKDPAALKPGTYMPNLELSEAEIEALAAFLMGELEE